MEEEPFGVFDEGFLAEFEEGFLGLLDTGIEFVGCGEIIISIPGTGGTGIACVEDPVVGVEGVFIEDGAEPSIDEAVEVGHGGVLVG